MLLKRIIKKFLRSNSWAAAAAAAWWCRTGVGVAVTGLSQPDGDSHKWWYNTTYQWTQRKLTTTENYACHWLYCNFLLFVAVYQPVLTVWQWRNHNQQAASRHRRPVLHQTVSPDLGPQTTPQPGFTSLPPVSSQDLSELPPSEPSSLPRMVCSNSSNCPMKLRLGDIIDLLILMYW